jgi:hypothetical protein
MSNRTKNEICLGLWKHYVALKIRIQIGIKAWMETEDQKQVILDEVKNFIEAFRHEIYLGARVEQKDAFNSAAANTFSLSAMQSMVLKKMGSIIVKQRLQFKETADQALKSMAGYVIVKTEWAGPETDPHAKVKIQKTDGEGLFNLEAENPWAFLKIDEPIWVTEPFISTGDNEGKAWYEMTSEEHAEANKKNEFRAASTFPKYLQKRRMHLAEIAINCDDRDAWLEMTFKNSPDFDRQTFEEDALKVELGIEGQTEGDDETGEETKATIDDTGNQGVDPDSMTTEDLERADDSHPEMPTIEPPTAEEEEP